MMARSLVNLLLRISGLFFIKDILDALSRSLSVLIYFPKYSSHSDAWYNLAVTLPSVVLYTFFVAMLLFRTDAVINILRLDRGLGDQFVPLRLHRSVVLSIAVVVAGGWLLISGLPEFMRQLFYFYQEKKLYVRMARPDLSYLVMALAKLVFGVLLISFNRTVVNIIEIKRRNRTAWYWPASVPFSKKKKKAV